MSATNKKKQEFLLEHAVERIELQKSQTTVVCVNSENDQTHTDLFSPDQRLAIIHRYQISQSLLPFKNLIYQFDNPAVNNDKGNSKCELVFDSNFEQGNLCSVYERNENVFDLILNFDTNTKAHSQWYFFSIKGVKRGVKYKFRIINFIKNRSSYSLGMKPLVYFEKSNVWERCGEDVLYEKGDIEREDGEYWYFLSWFYTHERDDEKIFFAHHYPYTYSTLLKELKNIKTDEKNKDIVKIDELCKSKLKIAVPLVTISNDVEELEKNKEKKVIFIVARQHPGETPGQWVMKGVIDFLISSDREALDLRNKYIFKIVPMMNPDGVILGNTRCTSTGVDINRVWNKKQLDNFPTVEALKKKMFYTLENKEIFMFLDLHGHSKKKGSFFFGNNSLERENKIKIRVFPKLCSLKYPRFFVEKNGMFTTSKKKRNTARCNIYKEMKIVRTYTIENSFCGALKGPLTGKHYITDDYMKIGIGLMKSLFSLSVEDDAERIHAERLIRIILPESKMKNLKKKMINRKKRALKKRFSKKNKTKSFPKTKMEFRRIEEECGDDEKKIVDEDEDINPEMDIKTSSDESNGNGTEESDFSEEIKEEKKTLTQRVTKFVKEKGSVFSIGLLMGLGIGIGIKMIQTRKQKK